MSSVPGARSIGDYLLSARSFTEYQAMFGLTAEDLRGRVLDCPGGAASFTATARDHGADAVAVDPVYAVPAKEVIARTGSELERGSAWTRASADRYRWDFYGSPQGHARLREESAELFVADLLSTPSRYVAGALPRLPFADGSFDLVVSSHLLFTYADRLDDDFHRTALLELARVSRREVRVFPLVDQTGEPRAELVETLVADLAAGGLPAHTRRVDYEFQRGADTMLVLEVAHRTGQAHGTGQASLTQASLADTPQPPYVAVIFTSVRTAEEAGYADTAAAMADLASRQPGYLGMESAREDVGITVSYWRDEDAAGAWKQVAEHLVAQRRGREVWYRDYRVRVAHVVRDYGSPP